jgi:hypothetical protein
MLLLAVQFKSSVLIAQFLQVQHQRKFLRFTGEYSVTVGLGFSRNCPNSLLTVRIIILRIIIIVLG